MADVFDSRACSLGEGPLWHPERQQFYWFDILEAKLCTQGPNGPEEWEFDEYVSAAGWVDHDRLLIASQTQLFTFNLETGEQIFIAVLESENTLTRSNDGRADPYGGFWIGTMGINAEPGAGAIYRYYQGEVRRLYSDITIANSICFSPDGHYAYYTDTSQKIIRRQALEPQNGWPSGAAEDWLDLSGEGLNPDGSVVDADGNIWNAQWGMGQVSCYTPDGTFVKSVAVGAKQSTCPAFGGAKGTDMLVTTAKENLSPEALEQDPEAGQTFIIKNLAKGQREHQVIL